jgi:hypothetical protein
MLSTVSITAAGKACDSEKLRVCNIAAAAALAGCLAKDCTKVCLVGGPLNPACKLCAMICTGIYLAGVLLCSELVGCGASTLFCKNNVCCGFTEASCGGNCCSSGETCCSGKCCSSCQICGNEECLPKCPTPPRTRCDDGVCLCPEDMVGCGDTCCATGQECCGGICCPAEGQKCCSAALQICCNANTECCGTECCDPNNCQECDPNTQTCKGCGFCEECKEVPDPIAGTRRACAPIQRDCLEGKFFNQATCQCECQITCPDGQEPDENCQCPCNLPCTIYKDGLCLDCERADPCTFCFFDPVSREGECRPKCGPGCCVTENNGHTFVKCDCNPFE